MAKSKSHTLEVTVHFDKPCTKQHAKFAFADNVWGKFFPAQFAKGSDTFNDSLPGEFKIGRVK